MWALGVKMNDIEDINNSIKHHYFFAWLSSGAAAVSLALLVFIQSSNLQAFWASLLFTVAIPFLVCSSAISKTVKAKYVSTNKVDYIHVLVISLGLWAFSFGLLALFYILSIVLFWVYSVVFIISLVLFFICVNELNKKLPNKAFKSPSAGTAKSAAL